MVYLGEVKNDMARHQNVTCARRAEAMAPTRSRPPLRPAGLGGFAGWRLVGAAPPRRIITAEPSRHPAVTCPAPFRFRVWFEWSNRVCYSAFVKSKILVVDDEPEAVELIEFNLKQAGFDVVTAADGKEALQRARTQVPALIVLDLMLPEVDGLEVCKRLRRDDATAGIPIIMLTARAAEVDRVVGLELGADDYVTKPFSPRELVLRIKKLLQRGQPPADKRQQMCFGDLLLDIPRHLATWKGKALDLTATEFKLLILLAQRAGRVQTRDVLLRDVWEYDNFIDTRTVDTHMRRLREKLGPAAKYLETVRGVGYRFVE